ncbi:hypothetical protein Tco_0104402 [Tanacetum coccineum]
MYDSLEKQNGVIHRIDNMERMILESDENVPICLQFDRKWMTRPKEYSYNHKVAKELWEIIQLLMQGTYMTKLKGFSLLLNDMNIYNMKLKQFQVNTEFLNTLPPEWSKFVTDVKLVQDLHTTDIDQASSIIGDNMNFIKEEEAAVLRDLVDHIKANYPLDPLLESACNTKKDKIQQTPSSTLKNKVEAHPRKVKSSLKNKECVVAPKGTAHVQHSKLIANYELKCVKCNGCMLFDNHDLCVLDFINNVNARAKSRSVKKNSKRKVWKPTGKVFTNIGYIWRPTGRTFTIVGNVCPLTRITTTTEVPLRKSSALDNKTPKPVVTLVYSRKPRKSKTSVPVNNYKVVQIVLWYLDSGCSKHMTGDRSQLTNFVNKFLGTVKFGNDHVAKIMGYGDYQIGNVTISRVYYVEGLGHNLFSVG